MKKILLLLLCLAPLLTGCGGLDAQRREVEHLRLMETMGLDPAPEGLILTLASPGRGEEGPLCVSGPGASVTLAMEALQDRAAQREFFCGHLQHILLGEAYARLGLDSLLAAVCRSPDLRLDMPVYLVLDATARELMIEAENGETGVCDLLNSLRGDSRGGLSSAGRILRDLNRQGCALIRALRPEDSPVPQQDARVLTPWGFGVLAEGRLVRTIAPEDAAAVELLAGDLRPCTMELRDSRGRLATLELQEGGTELRPLWAEDGSLAGLELQVRVRAALLELEGLGQAAELRVLNDLTGRMEAELSRRVGRVLGLSRELGADFLGLGRRIERQAPLKGRGLGRDLGALLPQLRLQVTVQGELRHSGDLN